MKHGSLDEYEHDSQAEDREDDPNLEPPDRFGEALKRDNRDVFRARSAAACVIVSLVVVCSAMSISESQREEHRNFVARAKKASTILAAAAVASQKETRDSVVSLSSQITSTANITNSTWPFFTMPFFERFARDALDRAGTEDLTVANLVTKANRDSYITYSNANHEAWVEESHLERGTLDSLNPAWYHPFITMYQVGGALRPDHERDFYFPSTTISPPPLSYNEINWNIMSSPVYNETINTMLELVNQTVLSPVYSSRAEPGNAYNKLNHRDSAGVDASIERPYSRIFSPIHVRHDDSSAVVGLVSAGIAWDVYLDALVLADMKYLVAILQNGCNQSYSFSIEEHGVVFKGIGDLHDSQYDELVTSVSLNWSPLSDSETAMGSCQYSMHIYPSRRFESSSHSGRPMHRALVAGSGFLLVGFVFFVYDQFLRRRSDRLVAKAARTSAIVDSIFPNTVRDRLLEEGTCATHKAEANTLTAYLLDGEGGTEVTLDSKPLADLFLETTVVFADIVGFTAWSSAREPSQVFTLLETVYSTFDAIAKRRRVFKVETVGDCYVAVTGLPEPRKDHAVAMARFASECVVGMAKTVKALEVVLGPDTGLLSIRVGLHSGPVTGGVLRGERSRFQLFGDTMNTASRIESTGKRGRIHLSEETALLLVAAGKSHWVVARENKVVAKGKGEIQTYWLDQAGTDTASEAGGGTLGSVATASDSRQEFDLSFSDVSSVDLGDLCIESHDTISCGSQRFNLDKQRSLSDLKLDDEGSCAEFVERQRRLIDWNVELLLRMLRQIIACRGDNQSSVTTVHDIKETDPSLAKGGSVLDQVKEIIEIPEFDRLAARRQKESSNVHVPDKVVSQLEGFVAGIASMYRDNPFHNFHHASHVVMSVSKLMSRIVAPSDDFALEPSANPQRLPRRRSLVAAALHDHTYGITSDPLTQFACVFSALIHDVDHMGVPNAQLVKEKSPFAVLYKRRSVAEQNSFDIAWVLLMDRRYDDLRACICGSKEELVRFRQLVINGVMATDIVDKELKELRNARWDKTFTSDQEQPISKTQSAREFEKSAQDDRNRKATIIIEHLIQASDVAHTMQHWHIYRKWNELLFLEMHRAFESGRAEKNPVDFWYQGELAFFDFYILPLSRKLKDCGVFGVSSDECLNYAKKNRAEWERRGQEIVSEMVEKLNSSDCETDTMNS